MVRKFVPASGNKAFAAGKARAFLQSTKDPERRAHRLLSCLCKRWKGAQDFLDRKFGHEDAMGSMAGQMVTCPVSFARVAPASMREHIVKQKDAKISPNHGAYFDFALNFLYNLLLPFLNRPTAHFKTASTKFKNVIEDSTGIVKQILNIFCVWEIIRQLFGGV